MNDLGIDRAQPRGARPPAGIAAGPRRADRRLHRRRCRTRPAALAQRLLALALAAFMPAGWPGSPATVGEALFDGDRPLQARIHGQDFVLPTRASRCANCHRTSVDRSGAASAADSRSFGPALTPEWLKEPQRRRGGPPSRYDATSLCTLLRTGVDPAHVIIPRAMPRYEASPADCEALWAFLARER